MICDECGLRPPSVHYVTIHDGQTQSDLHLCSICFEPRSHGSEALERASMEYERLLGRVSGIEPLGCALCRNDESVGPETDFDRLPDVVCDSCWQAIRYEAAQRSAWVAAREMNLPTGARERLARRIGLGEADETADEFLL